MNNDRKRMTYITGVVLIVAAVVVPLLLIAAAILEGTFYGTDHVTVLYQTVGIFRPLDWLFRVAADIF